MDQPNQPVQQPQGNFVMNLNFKRNNPNAPAITGRISAPEDPETEFSYTAFRQVDDNGQPYWIGPVETSRTMRQALNARPEAGTHFIAIRENGYKVFATLADGSPNPAYAALSDAEQKHEDSKPSYWASWTRTSDDPQLHAHAWERDSGRYGPWASGATQRPLTKAEAEALKAGKVADPMTQPEPRTASRRKTMTDDHERA